MDKINLDFKPEDLIKRLKQDDVEINVVNHNSIASVFKSGDKYMINIKNDLNQDLLRYFIFHEMAHVLNGHVENGEEKYFNFEFEDVDLLALKTYIKLDFNVESLKKSVLFERKLINPEFSKLIQKG